MRFREIAMLHDCCSMKWRRANRLRIVFLFCRIIAICFCFGYFYFYILTKKFKNLQKVGEGLHRNFWYHHQYIIWFNVVRQLWFCILVKLSRFIYLCILLVAWRWSSDKYQTFYWRRLWYPTRCLIILHTKFWELLDWNSELIRSE